jgi:ankyrin repeat protein
LTPLHEAARAGRVEAAKMLIAQGADVSSVDNKMATPMHLAARSKCPESGEVIKLFMDAGADVIALDNEKRTPLARAWLSDNVVAIHALEAPEMLQSSKRRGGKNAGRYESR